MTDLPESRMAGEKEESCPVCKSSWYTDRNIQFQMNPVCYHRMCTGCVDRIFSSGPAPCPIAGCGKTLRKNRFRKQTFEDLAIEREVDIRKRVMAILNRREPEFETPRDYNNFLEQREEIIFNLVSHTDVAATQAKLDAYATSHSTSIRHNAVLSRQESSTFATAQELEREAARLRREALRQEYEDEKREQLAGRNDLLNRLASGGAADAITREAVAQRVVLKKSSARRSEQDRLQLKQAALLAEKSRSRGTNNSNTKGGPVDTTTTTSVGNPIAASNFIQGLKKVVAPEPEKPYDPFMGMSDARDYFVLAPSYPTPYLDGAKKATETLAGGYDFREYYARSMLEAFAGLGVFVGEEVSRRDQPASKEEATSAAAVAAGGERSGKRAEDDVF